MKKGTVITMAIVLLLAFAGCGNESEITGQTEPADNIVTEDGTVPEKLKDDGDTSLSKVYNVPMENIYIDVPSYQEIELGYTELFIVHNEKYVAITTAFDDENTVTAAKDAHGKAFTIFKGNMADHEGGVNGITMTKEETQTVNGIEFYTYEGKIHYGVANKYDGYAIGCAFVMDGIPCEIVGSVVDPSQSEEMIEEIRSVVQAMMQSVRATP